MTVDIAILLVEDNTDDRELALAALRECCDPSRIIAVSDGEQALDYLLARKEHADRDARKQPRLVVLDINLPKMSGVDVLKAMRDEPNTQGVPVVMLTGTSEKDVLDRCYEAGANSVVRKAADFDELRRKMRQMYEFWITVNEANRNSRV
ncbi:MAG TPA: response regulator [Ramlibacter sp.]|jgi:two-component system response regulator|nr:response regulator [Ramlibacter sp.]